MKTKITITYGVRKYDFLLNVEHYCTMEIRDIFSGHRNKDEMLECGEACKKYNLYVRDCIKEVDGIEAPWKKVGMIKNALNKKIGLLEFGYNNRHLFKPNTFCYNGEAS